MRLKKLLTLTLAGALLISGIATVNAAELDVAWYAAKNPDVVAAFGNSPEMLKLHYDMFGRKEARMANTHDVEAQLRKMFNPTEYATLYPDVKAALGENAEAMFQHYMAFGLLESRRPSEKVSKETAANLKKSVEKALASAGIPALPGSAQLVAVLTGEIKADVVGGAAVQQALSQVASVVEKAVVETVQKVNNPSSGGGGGSSSSSSGSSNCGGNVVTVTVSDNDLLKEALNGNCDVIQLSNDIDTTGIIINRKVSLSLMNHTIKNNSGYALVVKDGGNVTISGGNIIGGNSTTPGIFLYGSANQRAKLILEHVTVTCTTSAKVTGVQLTDYADLIVGDGAKIIDTAGTAVGIMNADGDKKVSDTYCSVTVDGELKGKVFGLHVNGLIKDATKSNNIVTVNEGGKISGETGAGLYLAGLASTTIEDGATISGTSGIEIRAGKLVINGGDISSIVDAVVAPTTNECGSTVDGVALAVSEHNTRLGVDVTVNGGTLTSKNSNPKIYVTDKLTNEALGNKDIKVDVKGIGIKESDSAITIVKKDESNSKISIEYAASGEEANSTSISPQSSVNPEQPAAEQPKPADSVEQSNVEPEIKQPEQQDVPSGEQSAIPNEMEKPTEEIPSEG